MAELRARVSAARPTARPPRPTVRPYNLHAPARLTTSTSPPLHATAAGGRAPGLRALRHPGAGGDGGAGGHDGETRDELQADQGLPADPAPQPAADGGRPGSAGHLAGTSVRQVWVYSRYRLMAVIDVWEVQFNGRHRFMASIGAH